MNRVAVAPQPVRFVFVGAIIACLTGYLVWCLVQLQVMQHEELSQRAVAQSTRSRTLAAPRGSLYDGTGTPLAVSEGTWQIVADPEYMQDKLRATIELSRLLGVPREHLRAEFEASNNGRVVARALRDPEPGEPNLIADIRRLKLEGIRVEREWVRRYGQPGLAAHVLGLVGDNRGMGGVEQSMDGLLQGQNGRETFRVDALGRSIGEGELVTAPKPGANVQLTIDIAIQRKLEERLREAVETHAPIGACGIVVRPSTGEILAMASWPTFDPSNRASLLVANTKNLAISYNYEPGSTFKPLIAGAAVQEKLARWNEQIFCENGVYTFNGRTIHDHSYKTGGHQNLTIVMGIALSDNVLMAKLGLRMGPSLLADWVERLGFGQRTGIQLGGEERGQVAARSKFTRTGACMSIPMGHEISVTPLQLAMAHAAVANRGVWNPPRILRRAWRSDDDGRQIEQALPALPESRRFYSESDAFQIQDAMTHTMEEGTGKKAKLDGYSSAGKTGTAEKIVGGRYSKDNHVGSFVCWAPAEAGVQPEALCLVVMDDPKHGHYGGVVAAPAVKDVLQFTLEYLKVPKRESSAREDGPRAVTPARTRSRR